MPAWEVPGQRISLVAGADLTERIYRFVRLNASGQVVLSGATDVPVGVLYNRPANGQAATVVLNGVVLLYSGGSVSAGARVAPDANGRAVTAGATSVGYGIALTPATGADQLISVLLLPTAAVS